MKKLVLAALLVLGLTTGVSAQTALTAARPVPVPVPRPIPLPPAGPRAVPELDGSTAAVALALVAGGLALAVARRRSSLARRT